MCLISQSKHWGPWDLLTLSPFLIFLLLLGWPNLNELFGPTHFNPFTKSCFSSLGSPEPRRLCWVPQCWHGNTWASRGNSVLTGVSLCWAGLHVVTVQRPRWGPLLQGHCPCGIHRTGWPPTSLRVGGECWPTVEILRTLFYRTEWKTFQCDPDFTWEKQKYTDEPGKMIGIEAKIILHQ